MTGTGRLINANHQPNNINQIRLDKTLIEKCVEHSCRENAARGEWQAEQVGDLRALHAFDLFSFGYLLGKVVMGLELDESHIIRVDDLGADFHFWKHSKDVLNCHDCLGVV